MSRLLILISLVASCAAFAPAAPLALRGGPAPRQPLVAQPGQPGPLQPRLHRSGVGPQMGLFGLGYPEIAVIGVLALFLLGPDKLVPYAKEFGARRRQRDCLCPWAPRLV